MLQCNNTSGVTGVHRKTDNKYTAYAFVNGKRKHLGSFDNFEDAVAARESANITYNIKPRLILTDDERRASAKEYRETHRAQLNKDREARRQKLKQTDPLKICWMNKKSTAQQRGIPFNIKLEDLTVPQHCAACGTKLFLFKGGIAKQDTACLDRIHPKKGYTIDNWQWLCNSCNMMKSNYADPEVFLKAALAVYKNMKLHLPPDPTPAVNNVAVQYAPHGTAHHPAV